MPGAIPAIQCAKCGICCIAPDIGTLGKPLGVPCRHLTEEGLCSVYESRPAVCRAYEPDEVCLRVRYLPREEGVRRYLEIYGLLNQDERTVAAAAGGAKFAAEAQGHRGG